MKKFWNNFETSKNSITVPKFYLCISISIYLALKDSAILSLINDCFGKLNTNGDNLLWLDEFYSTLLPKRWWAEGPGFFYNSCLLISTILSENCLMPASIFLLLKNCHPLLFYKLPVALLFLFISWEKQFWPPPLFNMYIVCMASI